MHIGFDAKRAFHNKTGLGHYSRTLIHSLAEYFPEHQYYLFNPKTSDLFRFTEPNVHEVQPSGFPWTFVTAAWRSSGVTKVFPKYKIDLYHGLSHEVPMGIQKTSVKSVVTMHDLIHERFPEQYKAIDVKIYSKKFRYACEHADRIIAISNQTKQDLIEFYKMPAEKIDVCYQSCNPAFSLQVSEEEKKRVRKIYGLPEQFFLYVGSVIERKNLLNVCKALQIFQREAEIPLIVIGDGTTYKEDVKKFIDENTLESQVIFLSEKPVAKSDPAFQSAKVFPAIYQSAIAMIYPSTFEGFGIPVLEALFSKLPVITSNVSSLPEAGGNAAYYVNPLNAEEIAEGMKKIYNDTQFVEEITRKGIAHAQNFVPGKTAKAVMDVYKKVYADGS